MALAAAVPPERLVLHGNNKSLDELRAALEAGVGRVVVDSFEEIDRIESLVDEGLPVPRALARLTPRRSPHHEYVRTGPGRHQVRIRHRLRAATGPSPGCATPVPVDLVGTHVHIGSQVFVADFFHEAIEVLAPFVVPLDLPEFSIGGGLGSPMWKARPPPASPSGPRW